MDFDLVFVLWSDGGKLMAKTGPAFVPSRLSAIWIARELSRSCHAEDGTQEAWPKRARGVMGGEENHITPCARALSWGGIIFRAPICCLDSLLGCLRRYFGVFLWDCLFPSLISLLKGTDYSRTVLKSPPFLAFHILWKNVCLSVLMHLSVEEITIIANRHPLLEALRSGNKRHKTRPNKFSSVSRYVKRSWQVQNRVLWTITFVYKCFSLLVSNMSQGKSDIFWDLTDCKTTEVIRSK